MLPKKRRKRGCFLTALKDTFKGVDAKDAEEKQERAQRKAGQLEVKS
jgi:hypothetical protein